MPVRSLLERIAQDIGRPDLLAFGERPLSPSEPATIEADIARLTHEVGFVPHYDLDSGLAETVASWRADGSPSFTR